MRRIRWITASLLILCLFCFENVRGDYVNKNELNRAQRWAQAKFGNSPIPHPKRNSLTLSLKGKLLKNKATTKVYHTDVGALPLKINKTTYKRGIYCPSTGSIDVNLTRPAKKFTAIFGIDSNRVQSFYSNAGQGSVIGSVEVGGRELIRTKVMREGMPGVPIAVNLEGVTSFKLKMVDSGQGVVERVDFNQADWADARVEFEDGSSAWLGDMPTAPLRSNDSTDVPFSFIFDGKSSHEFLSKWKRQSSSRQIDERRSERTITFTDPKGQLTVRCLAIEYKDFPVVEWKLYLKNPGESDSPLIENILPLDSSFERDNEGEFILHHSKGSSHSLVRMSDITDYAPLTTTLKPRQSKTLGSKIGLPAVHDLPYFNITANGQGVIVAIGWPGQWKSELKRVSERGLHVKAGQEKTRFYLRPGEEVRTPMIAMLFWQGGDWIRAQNIWRRWMIAHNLPRTADNKLPPHQTAASSSAFYMESSQATEANQMDFINRYLEEGLQLDYWWIDAGWYNYSDYWLNVGTWQPNNRRFPNGIRPISDFLHSKKMKLILWFTPEVVTRGSHIDREHPDFLLKGGAEWWMGHALIQGEFPAHVNDSGLTMIEDVAAFGTGNPDATVTGKTKLNDGKWHLVTATRRIDKAANLSELRLYIDGHLDSRGTSPNIGLMNANKSFGIGRQFQTRGIKGEIDDVRVFDSALSHDEVTALFARRSRTKPIAHYSFDKTLKSRIREHVGKQIGSGQLNYVKGASNKPGDRALRFNNDYGVEIPNQAHKDYTLSCWVRMEAAQPPPWGRGNFRLFNFGDKRAAKWMTDHIDGQLIKQGVDFFRHDGIPPLAYWRANDSDGRQGMSEIRHIEGLMGFWDELRRRHPMLRIDICSGGGSRNELESLRRAVPLWRSDYAYETTGMQTLTFGMSLWIPYFGTGINATDPYTFRSQIAPANAISWDLRRKDADYDFCRTMLKQRREIIKFFYGDFYPLTAYRTENDVWMAWQFDIPEEGEGIIQAFRRPKSSAIAMRFKLRNLDPSSKYVVRNLDSRKEETVLGRELMNVGYTVHLDQPRSSALLRYQRAK